MNPKTDIRINKMVFPFLPCSSFVVSGQTSSGKTRFAYELLKHANVMFTEDPPDKIPYCYMVSTKIFIVKLNNQFQALHFQKDYHPNPKSKTSLVIRRSHPSSDSTQGYGITIHTRMPSQTNQCRVYHSKLLPEMNFLIRWEKTRKHTIDDSEMCLLTTDRVTYAHRIQFNQIIRICVVYFVYISFTNVV